MAALMTVAAKPPASERHQRRLGSQKFRVLEKVKKQVGRKWEMPRLGARNIAPEITFGKRSISAVRFAWIYKTMTTR